MMPKVLNFFEKIILNKYLLSFVWLFIFVFVCLAFGSIFFEDISFDIKYFVLLKIFLIYLDIYLFIKILKSYDIKQFNIWKMFLFIKIFLLLIIWALLFTKWFEPKVIYFLFITSFFVLFFVDSRIIFLLSFNYFVYIAFYTMLGYKEPALDFASNFYYFFIIWLIALISEQVLLHKIFK